MSTFNVELKRVVDDTYDISIGYELQSELIDDLGKGLVARGHEVRVVTRSLLLSQIQMSGICMRSLFVRSSLRLVSRWICL